MVWVERIADRLPN
jgi:hypothetical protein